MHIDPPPSRMAPSTPAGTGDPESPGQWAFGRWNFDERSGILSDGETATQLQPQVARLLAYFLDHQQRIVSRDELIAGAWGNRVVSDDAINRCISILRKALSPDDAHAFIETVARRGYLAHFPDAPEKTPAPGRRRRYRLAAAVAGVAAAILAGLFIRATDSTPQGQVARTAKPPLVAVLPFEFQGQPEESEFFARGIHDDLLTQLARLQSIRVISSTSVQEYRSGPRNLREIAQELGADSVMEGSVQVAGGRIRIHAQLIDARQDAHLWAETFDRDLKLANIFDAQSEIARAIVTSLNAALTAQDDAQLTALPTTSMAAYRAFHRAMAFRDTYPPDLLAGEYRGWLEEAVTLDPAFSRAWAELVINYGYLYFETGEPEWMHLADRAFQQLEASAPGSPDHLIGQAGYLYYVLRDYERAHTAVSRAIAANPSDVKALQLRSWIERRLGDFDSQLASLREIRLLDPRPPVWTITLLRNLILVHRFEEVEAELAAVRLENYYTEYFRALLDFRHRPDLAGLLESADRMCRLYRGPDCGWDLYVAARDYDRALTSLERDRGGPERAELLWSDRLRIFTLWLMKDDQQLANGMTRWQALVEASRNAEGEFHWPLAYLGAALLSGVQGDAAEARQLIERWFHLEPVDWAERSVNRHDACRVLGMIAAAEAAVRCIRDGLAEPSYVLPFWEPYLPFYDAIRDEPEFSGLLRELEGAQPPK